MNTFDWIRSFRNLANCGLAGARAAYDRCGAMTPEQAWESFGGKVPKSYGQLEEENEKLRDQLAEAKREWCKGKKCKEVAAALAERDREIRTHLVRHGLQPEEGGHPAEPLVGMMLGRLDGKLAAALQAHDAEFRMRRVAEEKLAAAERERDNYKVAFDADESARKLAQEVLPGRHLGKSYLQGALDEIAVQTARAPAAEQPAAPAGEKEDGK